MPWRVSKVVNERMRFVVRLEDGERMTDLCREFGISRKTGYKILNRFRKLGAEALGDFSRRPHRNPNRTPVEIEELVLECRFTQPTWGPKKLRAYLQRTQPGVAIPAASTIGELLKRKGLVRPRRKRRRASPTPLDQLTKATAPNVVWCADYKGQFRMKNNQYCYPLTITDQFSRTVLCCEALENTRTEGAFAAFSHTFRRYGLPRVIRTDNGSPFASTGLAGLSRLNVWLRRLNIQPERIQPGHPEQNGQHERMHLTLKQDATRPPGANMLHQQELFDGFQDTFNTKRPHEALGMKRPSDVYTPSSIPFPTVLPMPTYPLFDRCCRVATSGHVYINGWSCHITAALRTEYVGLREIGHKRWLVQFLGLELGEADENTKTFTPA